MQSTLRALSPDIQRLLSRGYYAQVVNEYGGRDLVFVIRADQLCEELQKPAAETAALLSEHESRIEPYQDAQDFGPEDDGEIDL